MFACLAVGATPAVGDEGETGANVEVSGVGFDVPVLVGDAVEGKAAAEGLGVESGTETDGAGDGTGNNGGVVGVDPGPWAEVLLCDSRFSRALFVKITASIIPVTTMARNSNRMIILVVRHRLPLLLPPSDS